MAINESVEKTEQALQVIANAGQKKMDARQRILDFKDKLREDRRAKRLLEKGY